MHLLTYILVGIGAAIAVVALAVVFVDDGGPDAVEPQADNGQSVTATASNAGGSPADQQTAADTSDDPQQGDNTGQQADDGQSVTETASNAGGSPADQQTAADTSDDPQQGDNTGQSADNGQSVTATASNAGGSPADQQTAADTSDDPQQGDNTGQSADNGQSVTATASNAGGSPADQQTAADTSDDPQQGDNTGQSAGEDAQIGESALEIDLAQVTPDGQAVFAGRAQPLAEVTIFEGDIILGKTTANDYGEWVVVLERPLGPGEHLVSVGTKSPSGETDIANLTLAIKLGDTENERPLVALLPASEMAIPELLQSPDDKAETAAVVEATPGSDADGKVARTGEVNVAPPPGFAKQLATDAPVVPALAPRSLSWKTNRELVIEGVSRGGVRVVATDAGRHFGESAVVEGGAWRVMGKLDAGRASRVMRFALHDGEGRIVATYKLPVATRDLSQGLDGSKLVVVQQGDALWRIAYRSYGEGIKYIDIVRRNAAAIDDPDLIFPNQIFAIPE